jgi:hypothetical protein
MDTVHISGMTATSGFITGVILEVDASAPPTTNWKFDQVKWFFSERTQARRGAKAMQQVHDILNIYGKSPVEGRQTPFDIAVLREFENITDAHEFGRLDAAHSVETNLIQQGIPVVRLPSTFYLDLTYFTPENRPDAKRVERLYAIKECQFTNRPRTAADEHKWPNGKVPRKFGRFDFYIAASMAAIVGSILQKLQTPDAFVDPKQPGFYGILTGAIKTEIVKSAFDATLKLENQLDAAIQSDEKVAKAWITKERRRLRPASETATKSTVSRPKHPTNKKTKPKKETRFAAVDEEKLWDSTDDLMSEFASKEKKDGEA